MSETLVKFYQDTRPYSLEDSHLWTHCRENIKSYLITMLFIVYVKHKRLFVEFSVCIALVIINSEGGGVEVT